MDVLATFADLTNTRQLKTDATWWTMYGGNFTNLISWLGENKLILALTVIGALIALFTDAIGWVQAAIQYFAGK